MKTTVRQITINKEGKFFVVSVIRGDRVKTYLPTNYSLDRIGRLLENGLLGVTFQYMRNTGEYAERFTQVLEPTGTNNTAGTLEDLESLGFDTTGIKSNDPIILEIKHESEVYLSDVEDYFFMLDYLARNHGLKKIEVDDAPGQDSIPGK